MIVGSVGSHETELVKAAIQFFITYLDPETNREVIAKLNSLLIANNRVLSSVNFMEMKNNLDTMRTTVARLLTGVRPEELTQLKKLYGEQEKPLEFNNLLELVPVYKKMAELEEGLKQRSPADYDIELTKCLQNLIKLGDVDVAFEIASGQSDANRRNKLLVVISTQNFAEGNIDRAIGCAEAISDQNKQSGTLSNLVADLKKVPNSQEKAIEAAAKNLLVADPLFDPSVAVARIC